MRVVIAHGHIFKNAGTSFDWALRRNFGKNFCDHRNDIAMRKGRSEYLGDFLRGADNLTAISSHHLCDVSQIKDISIHPVYFVRHPILRSLSVYNFERCQKSDTPGAVAAKKYCFRDYVKWRMDLSVGGTLRNYQTNYISHFQNGKFNREADFESLALAVMRLQENVSIGVVDEFDKSMVVIESRLKKYFPNLDLSYIKQNEGDKRPSSTNRNEFTLNYISDELGEVFGELLYANHLDMVLYREAKTKLLNDAKLTQDFDTKLLRFVSRCEELKERQPDLLF